MGLTNNEIEIRNWVEFGCSALSLICSFLTIFVIAYMRQWNGYLLLIVNMVFFQIIYDVNFLLGVYPSYQACVVWNFLDVLGGLSVSFWTNVLSFVVMYIVISIKSFDIFGNYPYFCIFTILIPFALAVASLLVIIPASTDDDKPFNYCVYDGSKFALILSYIYYWSRIASILFNIIAFAYIIWRVKLLKMVVGDEEEVMTQPLSINTPTMVPSYNHRVSLKNSSSLLAISNGSGNNNHSGGGTADNTINTPRLYSVDQQRLAIRTLTSRIKYYPIAQVIVRSGAIWNEYDDYKYSCFASAMWNAITGPTLGIFCFFIFLVSFF
jgi:hypothetical protein